MHAAAFAPTRRRVALVSVVGAIVSLMTMAMFARQASAATSATVTYDSPGSYSFLVPSGVSSVELSATGAAGGSCAPATGAGGRGASVSATVPVSPGERLFVGVGGPGGYLCAAVQSAGGAGGFGGGGTGGAGSGQSGGFGGGGASVVSSDNGSPAFSSLLLVAGGGGGASSTANGGDAGAAGSDTTAGGGGAGTNAAGGSAGAGSVPGVTTFPSGMDGTAGSFGVGGIGGDAASDGGSGGGGGGGGYYGGGGGGGGQGGLPGAGGGGGSSFIAPSAAIVSGPAVTSAPSGVTITYPLPTAELSAGSIGFGTQPEQTAGPEQVLTITNHSSASLLVSGVVLGGAKPGDYLIGNRCQQPVAAGASCQIGVRFAPQAQGLSSATLTVLSNAGTAPAPVSLSGTGGPAPAGPAGPRGPAGARGPKGAPGKIELVTCKTVTRYVRSHGRKVRVSHKQCKSKLVSGPIKFKVAGATVKAAISRGHLVYATGTAVAVGRTRSKLVLIERHAIRPGRYTLTLTSRQAHHTTTTHSPITID